MAHIEHRGNNHDSARGPHHVIHNASRTAEAAIEDATNTLRRSAKALGGRAVSQSKLAARRFRKEVREHPMACLSASVTAGLVVGALLTHRASHH